jgi:hypothetical protein
VRRPQPLAALLNAGLRLTERESQAADCAEPDTTSEHRQVQMAGNVPDVDRQVTESYASMASSQPSITHPLTV